MKSFRVSIVVPCMMGFVEWSDQRVGGDVERLKDVCASYVCTTGCSFMIPLHLFFRGRNSP